MNRIIPLMFVMLLGLIGSAQARDDRGAPRKEGTPVIIVGQVTSAPKKVAGVVQKHFQIALGPSKRDTYTLHVSDASEMVSLSGDKIAISDLDDKQWVRAEGRSWMTCTAPRSTGWR